MMVRINLKTGKLVSTGDNNAPIPHRNAGKPSGRYGKDEEDRKKYSYLDVQMNAGAAAGPSSLGMGRGTGQSSGMPGVVFGRGRGRGRVDQPTPAHIIPLPVAKMGLDDAKESALKKPPQETDDFLWNKYEDWEAFLASKPGQKGALSGSRRSNVTSHLRWSISGASEGRGQSGPEFNPQLEVELLKAEALAKKSRRPLIRRPGLDFSSDSEAELGTSDEEEEDKQELIEPIEMVWKNPREREAFEKIEENFLQDYQLYSKIGVGLIDIGSARDFDAAEAGTAKGE